MEEAETIVFLGFAYHQQNLKLLDTATFPKVDNNKRIFGTAYGLSNSNCDVVRRDVASLLGQKAQSDKVKINNDLTCYDLFTEYSRSLALR